MANLNKVMLIGNLTRDPEIKYTPKGTAVASFALAVNRNFTTESGEKREEVTFVEIEAYGRVAEIIGEYCKKGHPLFAEGRLKLDTWEEKATGQKRSRLKVVVENIQLLGRREGVSPKTAEDADAADTQRKPASHLPRPPADPDLDGPPDDIPFQ